MNLICKVLGHREGDLKMDTVKTYIPTGSAYHIYLCKRCRKIIHRRKEKLI